MPPKACRTLNVIKIITTLMNCAIALLGLLGIFLAAIAVALTGGALQYMSSYLQSGDWNNELTGGYAFLGGLAGEGLSFLGVVAALLLLIVCVGILVLFLLPSIHGIVLWGQTNRLMRAEFRHYLRFVRRDSIIKIICSMLAVILLLFNSNLRHISFTTLGCLLYLLAITGLEIWGLTLAGHFR